MGLPVGGLRLPSHNRPVLIFWYFQLHWGIRAQSSGNDNVDIWCIHHLRKCVACNFFFVSIPLTNLFYVSIICSRDNHQSCWDRIHYRGNVLRA